MDIKVLPRVFGALISLEQSLSRIETALPANGFSDIRQHLPKQKEVLKKMRRAANLLQLEIAKSDWTAATRSMNLFYGLHHLVRKDLVAAQRIVARHYRKGGRASVFASSVQSPAPKTGRLPGVTSTIH